MSLLSFIRPLGLAAALLAPAGPAAAQPAAMPAPAATPATSPLVAHALRLRPGDDLREALLAYVTTYHLEAGAVLTCVGSLTDVSLRLANQEGATHYHGHFEIVSLVGTLSATGGSHLHLSVADSTGRTLGGHLLAGCRVYTTAEVVLAALPALKFEREVDPTYGYRELVVKPVPAPRRRRAQ